MKIKHTMDKSNHCSRENEWWNECEFFSLTKHSLNEWKANGGWWIIKISVQFINFKWFSGWFVGSVTSWPRLRSHRTNDCRNKKWLLPLVGPKNSTFYPPLVTNTNCIMKNVHENLLHKKSTTTKRRSLTLRQCTHISWVLFWWPFSELCILIGAQRTSCFEYTHHGKEQEKSRKKCSQDKRKIRFGIIVTKPDQIQQ